MKTTQYPWYKERYLKNIRLGGVVFLVLLRGVMSWKRPDIQWKCLSVLTALSSHCRNLECYPAEKLVACLELLLKKQIKLAAESEDTVRNEKLVSSNSSHQQCSLQSHPEQCQ